MPAQSCADLLRVDVTDIGGAGSRITKASETTASGVTYCTVEGTLAPAIGFRVQLPTNSWTQRYLQIGCGGLCGNIPNEAGAAEGCQVLNKGGFVIGATDMGHEGHENFGADPQKRADFAYRGVHLTAVASKKLIKAFYGRAEAYSYFTGCSDGGREALMEAQRYPQDFNGIIAGAAAMNFQSQNGLYHGWQARSNTGADGKAILVASRLPILHAAVLKACDSLDGQVDGIISNPRACRFEPETVQCKAGATDTSQCLTAAEVGAVKRLYDGPRDPASGERLIIGGPQFGSELGWAGVFVPRSASEPIFSSTIALEALRGVSFPQNPPASFTLQDLTFDKATLSRLHALHPLYDATNPDLGKFAAAGGKLIIYHGWSDPHISPLNSIAYHQAVEKFMGKDKAAKFERLYLLPGMYHCAGGEGPSSVDMLTPMLEWVEHGAAPDAIVANMPDPKKGRSSFGQPDQGNKGPRDGARMPPGGAGAPPDAAGGPGMPPGGAGMPPGGPGAPPGGEHMRPPMDDAVASNPSVGSRPLFPYPYTAKYDGKGDPLKAGSYVRGSAQPVEIPAWAASDFFQPYKALQR
jgi:feruloyl esterase